MCVVWMGRERESGMERYMRWTDGWKRERGWKETDGGMEKERDRERWQSKHERVKENGEEDGQMDRERGESRKWWGTVRYRRIVAQQWRGTLQWALTSDSPSRCSISQSGSGINRNAAFTHFHYTNLNISPVSPHLACLTHPSVSLTTSCLHTRLFYRILSTVSHSAIPTYGLTGILHKEGSGRERKNEREKEGKKGNERKNERVMGKYESDTEEWKGEGLRKWVRKNERNKEKEKSKSKSQRNRGKKKGKKERKNK